MSSVMIMLRMLMLDQMYSGDWKEAERTGHQALELSTAHGHVLLAYHTRAVLGQLAARQRRLGAARQPQSAVDAWARPRGVGLLTQITEAIATGVPLTEGDFEAACLCAIGMTPPGSFDRHAHQIAPRALLELVEASLHSGRREQARQHTLAAREAGLPEASPRLALSAYGALAMTAADDLAEATTMYARVEAHPAAGDFPFELARIRLAYGSALQRLKEPRAARQALVPAAEAFDRLGCAAWADRARTELRFVGHPLAPSARDVAALTWQERRIAELAATGLTNKEIGERTRLSPRAVSSRLYRVFPRLGITSPAPPCATRSQPRLRGVRRRPLQHRHPVGSGGRNAPGRRSTHRASGCDLRRHSDRTERCGRADLRRPAPRRATGLRPQGRWQRAITPHHAPPCTGSRPGRPCRRRRSSRVPLPPHEASPDAPTAQAAPFGRAPQIPKGFHMRFQSPSRRNCISPFPRHS